MKRIGIVGIALALIFIGAMLLYNVAYPSVTLRYRLTVEAEVDGHPKIGSGVREVTYTKQPGLPQYYDRMLDGQRNETVSSELRLGQFARFRCFQGWPIGPANFRQHHMGRHRIV